MKYKRKTVFMNIFGVFNMDSRLWHNFEISKPMFELLALSVLQNI